MRHCLRYITLLLAVFLFSFCAEVSAHELQPASLELKQVSSARYEVIWRPPFYYGRPHPASVQLPESWKTVTMPTVRHLSDSALHEWIVEVPDAIDNQEIRFKNLEQTITDVFVRVSWLDGTHMSAVARPDTPWVKIDAQSSHFEVMRDYTVLGVEHILLGFDHLLFVLALLLIVRNWQQMLKTITSFTVAHSITLIGTTLGFFSVPGPPVEATIALSILFLASELIKVNRGETSLTARNPWIVAFAFGLLHGFGFAGALADIGLPQNEVMLALLMFNIGVELGQIMFMVAVLGLIATLKHARLSASVWSRHASAYGIGSLAAFWFIERVSGF